MVWASFLGGSTGSDRARTIGLDSAGDVWVSGTAASVDFPDASGVPGGSEFLAEFNPSGSALLYGARFPANTVAAAEAVDRSGVVHLAGATGLVSTLTAGQSSAPRVFGLANAAGGVLAGRVAPGEVISIYGLHLGASAPTVASFDASGFLPTTLAGIQVTINGRPAPLLYVSDTQINAVTPFELVKLVNTGAVLQLSANGTVLPEFRLAVDPAIPEVFRLPNGMAAAINQDGTVNSPTNPAKIGSIVSIWATGVGYTPNQIDGHVGMFNPTSCCTIHDPYDVLSTPYAGDAPGLVTGIIQINFQVTKYPFTLSAGGKSSAEFGISVTP
jgi:uncharacterized protein (TIGR03437 family)